MSNADLITRIDAGEFVTSGDEDIALLIPADVPASIPGVFTPTSLTLPEGLDFDQWQAIGKTLRGIGNGIQWWIGDWWAYGKRRWGDKAWQAVEGYSENGVEHMGWVARRFDPLPTSEHTGTPILLAPTELQASIHPTRRETLSYTHHQEVAPLVDSAPEKAVEILDKAEAENLTTRQVRLEVKKARLQIQLASLPAHVPFPDNKYACIVIDPPWPVTKIEREVRPNQGAILDYPTMTLEQIEGLPIGNLAHEDGCHVYLWTTQKYLPVGMGLFESWGVAYQCTLTWVKPTGMTPYSWMYNTEHVLFGRIGSLPLTRLGLKLSFDAPITRHSEKPDVFYERVIQASPGPRLEMFARTSREGFDSWGNEVTENAA